MSKITKIETWTENLSLVRPYKIAFKEVTSVENIFLRIEDDQGNFGYGAASPGGVITHESIEDCQNALKSLEALKGQEISRALALCRELSFELRKTPAALACVDMALHDLFCKKMNISLVNYLGQVHKKLPTSVTIGINPVKETLEDVREFIGKGFFILKIKTGKNVEEDTHLLHKVREEVGKDVLIRIDGNQGYTASELTKFLKDTSGLNLEMIEQPFQGDDLSWNNQFSLEEKSKFAADESLVDDKDAFKLASMVPRPFGIYNIKFMKCGGITTAAIMAEIARLSKIEVMWGCMDESCISISAALQTAYSCPATKYIDLDGHFDLASDVCIGGYILENGYMLPNGKPGLGVSKKDKS